MKKTQPRSTEEPGKKDSTAELSHRPKVRWSVLLCAVGAMALVVGYFSGRSLPAPAFVPADSQQQSPVTEVRTAEANSTETALPDPERPRPQDVKGMTQEIREAMDYLLAVFPNTPDALEMKARTEQYLGNSDDALRAWQQCLELNANYVHAYIGMAQTAANKGEHSQAVELATRAIEIDSSNFQARMVKADALVQLGRPAEAIPVLEDHVKVDPRSQGFYTLGQAYFDLKQFERARDNLEAAIEKYPEFVEAYYLLSRTYRELGNDELAKRRLEEHQKLSTPNRMIERLRGENVTDLDQMCAGTAVLYADAGRLFMLRDRPADAEVFWRRAARLDSKNVGCRQSLAYLCRNNNRIGETIVWFKELAEIEPANVSYWTEMGRLFEEMSALPAAEKAFQKACETAPEKADGFAALADLLLRYDRNPPLAVTLAGAAVARRPTPENHARLSAAYLSNGENTAALEAIQQALRMAPESASYRAVLDAIKKDQ